MKSLSHHIKHVKSQPHHIRKRVAFSVAGAGTALVALVWLVGSLSLGSFAIAGSSFADSTGQGSVTASAAAGTSLLAGAAAAAPETVTVTVPHIDVVDVRPTISAQKKAEPTILPF